MIVRHVIVYLGIAKRRKSYLRLCHKALLMMSGGERDTRKHLVRLARQTMQHSNGFGIIMRFFEYRPLQPHNRIGCNDKLIGSNQLTVGVGFLARDVKGNIPSL